MKTIIASLAICSTVFGQDKLQELEDRVQRIETEQMAREFKERLQKASDESDRSWKIIEAALLKGRE